GVPVIRDGNSVSEFIILMCRFFASLGAGPDRWGELVRMIDEPSLTASTAGFGVWLIRSLEFLVRIIATAFGYSFFWCMSAAVYLLLRRDVDETEFDEVYIENEDRRYELPELKPIASLTTGDDTARSQTPSKEATPDTSPSDS
ncbi:MAG: hypothetical protein JJ992_21650, partial [Planctomycetes bacterium]|nr:hypothetical protein [Planctomycetota bacterium]